MQYNMHIFIYIFTTSISSQYDFFNTNMCHIIILISSATSSCNHPQKKRHFVDGEREKEIVELAKQLKNKRFYFLNAKLRIKNEQTNIVHQRLLLIATTRLAMLTCTINKPTCDS